MKTTNETPVKPSVTHTPGPWHINTLEVIKSSIHSARGHVADVSTGTMGECECDEVEANARLIAAAPELLAALETMQLDLRIAYAAAYCGKQNWTPAQREQYRVAACKADTQSIAAIAKAKGL